MIGRRLKVARASAGLSLRDLAARMDGLVTPQAIGKYERNEDMPGSRVLIGLAKALKVSEAYLLSDEDLTVLSRTDRSLSLADTFAFALAQARRWTLLTGDAGLRRAAEAHQLEVHGALWVFDQLEASRTCAAQVLDEALTRTTSHPRCRLPRTEVARRLARYRAEP